ncbi:Radical SAM superfamily enzyme YgiQ, UPF0313 family [Nannocystis exedens]|uniref:Radical SAM superfamily enzyme YgiQ, UPF0313 family n=2 Tax=Nannocystis exedens TaxID=54 RepID=A0A1I2IW40_9BACT|nr:B12-binding domain-containing radical SAM protein [Nannocystis exedens]SFF46419.1 Radical SAM superfamily enzyme YgiQ, UPF0313 family [Nannocystis exedens]
MRILLVYAEFPRTYWGFQYTLHIVGKRASLPPLGLVTVASHLPAEWELRLVDMNVERLDDEALLWADAVLVGGMLIQAPSMRAVVRRARALGRRTVVGGPAASTSPGEFAEADVVFGGEVEGREAELIALIAPRAARRPVVGARQILVPLRKDARPSVTSSPVPRFDLLELSAYSGMCVQYSRGCPFRCEFCDIIEIFGRVPRTKTPAQVVAELETLRKLGWTGAVFVVDDNFIGNIKQVRQLLPELGAWQEAHGHPFELYTEASLNLARDAALVSAMIAAGFTSVFLGIETPSAEALAETQKTQNLRVDLVAAVEALTRAGLEVMGGFIVGFDSDKPSAFEVQRRFLADAPIPLAMVGLLTALPDTQLWRRLEAEGRLRHESGGDQMTRPNFVPVMDEEALLAGYADLLRELYSVDGYLRRCRAALAMLPEPPVLYKQRSWIPILARVLTTLGVASPRRRMFWSLVAEALRRSPRFVPWAIGKAIQGEHLIRFTEADLLPRIERALAEVRQSRPESAVRGRDSRRTTADAGAW